MRIPSGVTDQYIYFVAVDATDLKTRETGLSSFSVYRSRNGGAAAAMTTPTVNETDATNMPGVYELLLDEDMTISAGNDSEEMVFHITASGMAPVTRVIELYRPKITAGNTLGVESDGDLTQVNSLAGHTAQTGDNYARLGAPVGASVSADIAGVQSDTDDIQTRLPATLVGGRMDSDVGAIQDNTITSGKIATDAITSTQLALSAVQEIRDSILADSTPFNGADIATILASMGTILASGTAQGGSSNTIQLAASEAFADSELNYNVVKITGGTGVGQARLISSYVGATDTATVTPNWITTPDATSTYEIVEGSTFVALLKDDVFTFSSIQANAITNLALATSAINEIVDGVWDEDIVTAHNGANTAGNLLDTDLAAILADTNELQTDDVPGLIAALNDLSAAQVNAEVVDVLFTDTISELAQAIPAATPTIATAVMLLYMMGRNKVDVDASFKEIHNDAGTVIAKKALSDTGAVYSEAEMVSGP